MTQRPEPPSDGMPPTQSWPQASLPIGAVPTQPLPIGAGAPPDPTGVPKAKRKHTAGIAITVAVFTSIIAIVAVGFGVYEAGQASTARKTVAVGPTVAGSARTLPTTAPTPTGTGTSSSTGTPSGDDSSSPTRDRPQRHLHHRLPQAAARVANGVRL